jgi:breast cancer 2 susceptibility protein
MRTHSGDSDLSSVSLDDEKATKSSIFKSAATIAESGNDPYDDDVLEQPSEVDYSTWFLPATGLEGGFQSASFASAASAFDTGSSGGMSAGFQSASGFQTAGKRSLAPSADALVKAKQKMMCWDTEDTTSLQKTSATQDIPGPSAETNIPSQRPVLQSVENKTISTGFSSPSASKSFASPFKAGNKPFKSPLIRSTDVSTPKKTTSPLNPLASSVKLSTPGFTSSKSQQPTFSTPVNIASSPASRPVRIGQSSPALRQSRKPFVTPFKPGMKPGEPGRQLLEERLKSKSKPVTAVGQETPSPPPNSWSNMNFFTPTPLDVRHRRTRGITIVDSSSLY